MYISFLLIKVCNQGKTLCSPCTFYYLTCISRFLIVFILPNQSTFYHKYDTDITYTATALSHTAIVYYNFLYICIENQHCALGFVNKCITNAAPTCFGTYVPSSGSVFVLVSTWKLRQQCTASGDVKLCALCAGLWCCTVLCLCAGLLCCTVLCLCAGLWCCTVLCLCAGLWCCTVLCLCAGLWCCTVLCFPAEFILSPSLSGSTSSNQQCRCSEAKICGIFGSRS
jgi:hypothetical protein